MAVKNRKRAIVLEWKWLRWMTSIRARIDTVEVGDKRLHSNRHGGSGWRAFEPVEVGDERLRLNRHGGGRWWAFELEWTWWRWGRLGSNGHDRSGRWAFGLCCIHLSTETTKHNIRSLLRTLRNDQVTTGALSKYLDGSSVSSETTSERQPGYDLLPVTQRRQCITTISFLSDPHAGIYIYIFIITMILADGITFRTK